MAIFLLKNYIFYIPQTIMISFQQFSLYLKNVWDFFRISAIILWELITLNIIYIILDIIHLWYSFYTVVPL